MEGVANCFNCDQSLSKKAEKFGLFEKDSATRTRLFYKVQQITQIEYDVETNKKSFVCAVCRNILVSIFHLENAFKGKADDKSPSLNDPPDPPVIKLKEEDILKESLTELEKIIEKKVPQKEVSNNNDCLYSEDEDPFTEIAPGEISELITGCEKGSDISNAIEALGFGDEPKDETSPAEPVLKPPEKPQKRKLKGEILDGEERSKIEERLISGKRVFACQVCDSTFSYRTNLYRHMIGVHQPDRPYECDQCPKNFYLSTHLRDHRNVHTGEKPHKCQICQKSFTVKTNLRRHARKSHESENVRKVGAKTNKRNDPVQTYVQIPRVKPLKQSDTNILKENSLTCTECGKSFKHEPTLKEHMNVHTGEKPNKCKFCPKSFSFRTNLTRHSKKCGNF